MCAIVVVKVPINEWNAIFNLFELFLPRHELAIRVAVVIPDGFSPTMPPDICMCS